MIFPTFDENNFVNFGAPLHQQKVTLNLKFTRVVEVVEAHVQAKFIKLSYCVNKLFCPISQMLNNPKIQSCQVQCFMSYCAHKEKTQMKTILSVYRTQ